jgi:hypothetical protein
MTIRRAFRRSTARLEPSRGQAAEAPYVTAGRRERGGH